jgi:hypothetical protein
VAPSGLVKPISLPLRSSEILSKARTIPSCRLPAHPWCLARRHRDGAKAPPRNHGKRAKPYIPSEQGSKISKAIRNDSGMATAEQLIEIRKRRGPWSDPRYGRLMRQIDWAFEHHNTDVLPSTILVDWCYGQKCLRALVGSPSWHRQMVKKAALRMCIPLGRKSGRGAGRGQPTWYRLDPEKAALRGWRKRDRKLAERGKLK